MEDYLQPLLGTKTKKIDPPVEKPEPKSQSILDIFKENQGKLLVLPDLTGNFIVSYDGTALKLTRNHSKISGSIESYWYHYVDNHQTIKFYMVNGHIFDLSVKYGKTFSINGASFNSYWK